MTPNLFILFFQKPKTMSSGYIDFEVILGAGDVLLVGIDTRMSVDG